MSKTEVYSLALRVLSSTLQVESSAWRAVGEVPGEQEEIQDLRSAITWLERELQNEFTLEELGHEGD